LLQRYFFIVKLQVILLEFKNVYAKASNDSSVCSIFPDIVYMSVKIPPRLLQTSLAASKHVVHKQVDRQHRNTLLRSKHDLKSGGR